MKVTSDKQIAALLKEYPLIRDACIRFDLRPETIEARNIKPEDCLEKIRTVFASMFDRVPNFQLYFYDSNGLFLGRMETKNKFSYEQFFYPFMPQNFTSENMLDALNRIRPVRVPVYALKTNTDGTELLLLKAPSDVSSLWEFARTAVANKEERENAEKEQAEREVREALKQEFGE
ncbi:MAG: hypothetical protein WC878_01205 [Candidatus Paceibacterota bacterium]